MKKKLIVLTDTLYEQLEAKAAQLNVPIASIINIALSEWLMACRLNPTFPDNVIKESKETAHQNKIERGKKEARKALKGLIVNLKELKESKETLHH